MSERFTIIVGFTETQALCSIYEIDDLTNLLILQNYGCDSTIAKAIIAYSKYAVENIAIEFDEYSKLIAECIARLKTGFKPKQVLSFIAEYATAGRVK